MEGAELGRLLGLHQRGAVIPWVRHYVLAADPFLIHPVSGSLPRAWAAGGGPCSST